MGEAEQGGELLQVVVLAGPHVAAQRHMQRAVVEVLAADLFQLGEPVQHPQVDVERVGVGDVLHPGVVVGYVGG